MKKVISIVLIVMLLMSTFWTIYAESYTLTDIPSKESFELGLEQDIREDINPSSEWLGLYSDNMQKQNHEIIDLDNVKRMKENLINYEDVRITNHSITSKNNRSTELKGIIYETEPNHNISLADRIYPNYAFSGTITTYNFDVDCYVLKLDQPGKLSIMGMWVGDYEDFGWEDDLLFGLSDSDDNLIDIGNFIRNNDGTASRYLSINLPAGTYYINVIASNEYGNIYVGEPYLFGAFFEPSLVSVSSVSLNKNSISLNVGKSEKLTATVKPTNATNKNLLWSSSNTSVATVNDGLVTGVGAGTSIITVRTQDGNKVASCAVTVASPTPIPAGEGDHFYKNEGTLAYSSNQVRASVTARNHVRVFPNLFQIKVGNILYDLVDANSVYNEDSINWKTLLAERYGSQETIIGKIEEELAGKIILIEVVDSSKVERIIFNGRVLNSDVWEYAIDGNLVRIPINEEIEKVIITIDRVDYRVVLFE